MKKIIKTSIIILILLLFAGGIGAFIYFSFQKGPEMSATSPDGIVTLEAIFYDLSTLGKTQSIIGDSWERKTHVAFQLSATNTGEIDLFDVGIDATNNNLNGAFDNLQPISSLAVDEFSILGLSSSSCSSDIECDMNEECADTDLDSIPDTCLINLNQFEVGATINDISFEVNLKGNFYDALGNIQTTTSLPISLSYDIRTETCLDGTPIETCAVSNQPKYCEFTEGSQPALIDKASVCGCPSGQEPIGDSCSDLICADGTLVGECSTKSHVMDFGAYYLCTEEQTFEESCNLCGCTDDYYGNPAIGCSLPIDPSPCEFQTYEGGLEAGIGEPDGGGTTEFVEFRTNDISYGSSSRIAYSTICGNTLMKFRRTASSGSLYGTCSTWNPPGYSRVVYNLPGGWKSGGENPSLWWDGNYLRVCDDDGSQYSYRAYTQDSGIDIPTSPNPDPLYENQEILC